MRSLVLLIVVTALILSMFVVGEVVGRFLTYRAIRARVPAQTRPVTVGEVLRHTFFNFVHRFPRPIQEKRLLHSGLPVYELRIDPGKLDKLRQTAERVMAADLSIGIPREYVAAQFLMDGDWVDVDVKLRGLTSSHYWRARPSLRIRFPKNRPFRGMRQINISTPLDKGLTKDVVTNWELARHGLMTWQSRFVVLKVNDEVVGMFQEIEQFGRSLPDRNGRTEGYIFSGEGQLFGSAGGFAWDRASAAIETFMRRTGQEAAAADEGSCDNGALLDIIDPDLFAWAGAVSALLGSSHAWFGDNLRLYFDPARGRLEPIPWDYSSYPIDPAARPEGEPSVDGIGGALFSIPELRKMRDERLWTLATKRVEPMVAESERIFAEIAQPLANNMRRPGAADGDRAMFAATIAELRSNAEFVRSRLERGDLDVTVTRRSDAVVLDIENLAKAYVVVRSVVLERDGQREVLALPEEGRVDGVWLTVPGRNRFVLPLKGSMEPSQVRVLGVEAVNGVTGSPLSSTSIEMIDAGVVEGEGRWRSCDDDPAAVTMLPPGLRRRGTVIEMGPGEVVLNRPLTIDSDHSLVILPGTRLLLAPGASLFLECDLRAVGTREHPIVVEGSVPSGEWGAVAVQGTRSEPRNVEMAWVKMRGGGGAASGRSHFTGAFAVTDGVVSLRHCNFSAGRADDGINLRYCEVDITDTTVEASMDDAIDLDFCHGIVEGGGAINPGGDGLDVSGAALIVSGASFSGCGDKGLSIGEGSTVHVRETQVSNCRIGVAVKDGSRATIEQSCLSHLEIGVATYRKKLTFGLPNAHLTSATVADTKAAVYVAPGARLSVDDSVRFVAPSSRSESTDGLAVEVLASERVPEKDALSHGFCQEPLT